MKLRRDILDVLRRSITSGDRLYLPPNGIERALYNRVDAVVEAAGGTWDRSRRAYVFTTTTAEAAVSSMLRTHEVPRPNEVGFQASPAPMRDHLVALASIEPGMRVLEPSAGTGAIADLLVAQGADVTCVDFLAANAEVLRAKGHRVVHDDFLCVTQREIGTFERIVMHPPFSRCSDIPHVTRALRFLAPRGRLVAAVFAGTMHRNDPPARKFRVLLDRVQARVEEMPADWFVVRACSVTIERCWRHISRLPRRRNHRVNA